MFNKIAIRNIPAAIWDGLVGLANQHDRSTEAEARYAIKSWVEPHLRDDNRTARKVEVSARLRDLQAQVVEAKNGRALKPSHIAEAIGESHAEAVEAWFCGTEEPSFKQLEAIAKYFGASRDWLKHGDRQMFAVESARIPEDPAQAVSWLLDLDSTEKVTYLHLVREADETGSFVLVKQYGEWNCKVLITPYHLSEVIGAGGEAALAYLSLIFELLYKYLRAGDRLMVKSYLLPKEDFQNLCSGKVHPLIALRSGGLAALWWEDFWNEELFPKQDYWPGWSALCERINRVVKLKPLLHEEKELIRSGQHPLLKIS